MVKCFRALFGTPLGPGTLPTLSPLMASQTSSGLVNFRSLAGGWRYDSSATPTVSMKARTEGTVTG